MGKKPSPTLVGAFILGAILLIVAAVAVWGSGRLFDRRYRYVCYFPGSVNGLAEGAPVKFRGVPVGSVVGMRIRFEQALDDTRIPVFVEVSDRRVRELGGREGPTPKLVNELIARGLRARLESQSLVTGALFVNLDFFPDTPIERVHVERSYPEIPTLPTALEETMKSLSALLVQIRDADIAGIARSLESTIEGIHRLINTPAIGKTLGELPPAVVAFRKLGENMDSSLAARGPVVAQLQRALMAVENAAESVRALANFYQRNPNALIVGKKRPSR